MPSELVARSLYNAKVLWRRPISVRFGDMGSLMVATPERLFLKDGTGVLILNPETGEQISRIEATKEPWNVSWLAVADGVLLTLAGPRSFNPNTDIQGGVSSENREALFTAWKNVTEGHALAAWDARSGKRLWRFTEGQIATRKLAVSGGRVFLHVGGSDALALDLRSGKQLWKSPAPLPVPRLRTMVDALGVMNENRGEPHAVATPAAYVIFDPVHLQYQAFAAADGHPLWNRPVDPANRWGGPRYPLVLGNTLYGGKPCNLLTGELIEELARRNITCSASCGHYTAVDCGENGLFVGNGVGDMKTGRQVVAVR